MFLCRTEAKAHSLAMTAARSHDYQFLLERCAVSAGKAPKVLPTHIGSILQLTPLSFSDVSSPPVSSLHNRVTYLRPFFCVFHGRCRWAGWVFIERRKLEQYYREPWSIVKGGVFHGCRSKRFLFSSCFDQVVGTHFFSPADVMRLLENVRGAQSSERALATIQKLGKTISKVPVMVGNCFGFVGNRTFAVFRLL